MFSPKPDHLVVLVYLKLIALVLLSSFAFIVGAAFWWWVCGGVESRPITYPFIQSQTFEGRRTDKH